MSNILKTTLLGLFFGTFGTTIGGIIGVCVKHTSNKVLSFILEFAAGLMISIVCFDLVPEAMELSNIVTVFCGIILGVCSMIICDGLIKVKYNTNVLPKRNSLLKTGLIIGIGLALHNFPEGLAIGSGFGASYKLGISLALAIAIHDVPEGISMAVPMKSGGMKATKALILTFASGITTGIGAFFGVIARKHKHKLNKHLPILCSRSNAIHSIRRTNSRVKQVIQWESSNNWKYFRIYYWNPCN